MNNKQDSNKILLISSVVFILVAIVLFVVQNFALSNKKVETVSVFMANKTIKPYDALTPDMFTVTSIPKEGNTVITNQYATSIQDFANMFAKSTINKGEILSKSRIVADNDEKGLDYSVLLDAPYVGDVAYGDNVKVYAMDSVSESITVLFKRKKIYKSKIAATEEVAQEDIATSEATGVDYEAATSMYIRVSAAELKEYYKVKRNKELIVVPILNDEEIDVSNPTNGTQKPVKDEEEKEETTTQNTGRPNHVVTGDNETLETISKLTGVSTKDLIKANPSIDSTSQKLAKGTEVVIPASADEE